MTTFDIEIDVPLQQRIAALAHAAGLQIEWTDAFNHPQKVSWPALSRILNAMDLPHHTDAAFENSLRRVDHRSEAADLPPLLTAEVDAPVSLPRLGWLYGQAYSVTLDDGESFEGVVSGDAGQASAPTLAPIARHGYHSLTVSGRRTTLAVAPRHCFSVQDAVHAGHAEAGAAGRWGLALQLYGLRRPGDGGIGDFSSLATLARAAAGYGASAVTISPVHAMFSDDALRYSPYGPSSRLFLNAMHIDPAAVMGQAVLNEIIADGEPVLAALHAALDQSPLIDWPRAAGHRLDLLRRLFARFNASAEPEQHAALAAFRRACGPALEHHARYEALNAWLRQRDPHALSDWRSWPEAYRRADTPEVEAFAAAHGAEIDFHVFLQWQAARGLKAAQRAAREAGMAIGLISDLAVGAESGGSQAWSNQGEIINGLSIGAPPDLLNTRGQNWGLGAFSPFAMRERGYRGYIDMLRACFEYAGGVRIDHVLGLARIWLVPEGVDAREGAYLAYPTQDMLRLIALESWRYRAIVIGEDLGTVPAGFDTQLAHAGLLGIRVLWFETFYGGFKAPADWAANAIAVSTTHDLPTIAGWWSGHDIDWQIRLGLLPQGVDGEQQHAQRAQLRRELWQALCDAGCVEGEQALPAPTAAEAPIEAIIRFLALTPAPLMILPLEDAMGLQEAPNLPGTIEGHPNWRRRMPLPVAALLDDPDCARRLRLLGRLRR
ncbi:4-alpha-glucanotransferase [Oxalobacteraceae bacterium CAVE-383]|nr:4-alpha-glucanotransferase [Oxalobacteraceae bacterium CAVE-383]